MGALEHPASHSAEELHARYATHLDVFRHQLEGILLDPHVRARRLEAVIGLAVLNDLSEAAERAVAEGDIASYPEAVMTIADGCKHDIARQDSPLYMALEAARGALLQTYERRENAAAERVSAAVAE